MTEAAAGAAGAAAAGAGAATAWHSGIDVDLIKHAGEKGWSLENPIEAFKYAATAYRNSEKMLGGNPADIIRIAKPTDDAAYKAMWHKLGAPADPKDYDFAGIKRADGADLAPAMADALRASLAAAYVPKDRAGDIVKGIVKHLDDTAAAEFTTRKAAVDAERADLLKSWGPKAEFNRLTAMQGAQRLGVSPEEVAKLENVVGYSRIMEMFRKIGAGTTEDTFVEGKGGGSPTTAAAAQTRLDELMKDTAWAKRLTEGGTAEKQQFFALTEQIAGISAAAA